VNKREYWNCLDHPDIRERAIKITEEVIKKYNPDEVYLDYIRYKDGYDTSCSCEYSMKKKTEFSKLHPEILQNQLDKEFAKFSLLSFVDEWAKRCKKLDPNIKTNCYTYIVPSAFNKDWVNAYPLDMHAKYSSRFLTGPNSSLTAVEKTTEFCCNWANAVHPNCTFCPILSAYDRKTPERIYTEFAIVSNVQDRMNVKFKRVDWYTYEMLLHGNQYPTPRSYVIDEKLAQAVSRALGGTWNNSANKNK
jgi:hypothetical protein